MKMMEPRINNSRPKLRAKFPDLSAMAATAMAVLCLTVLYVNAASSQGLRRAARIQKKVEKKLNQPSGASPASNSNDKPSALADENADPAASNSPETGAPKTGAKALVPTSTAPAGAGAMAGRRIQGGNSLDGIRQRGIRSLFTQEELSLLIPGFGNSPMILLVIYRQLDLTPEQKTKIRGIRREIQNRLQLTRRDLNQLEAQLDEAIYGNLDPASLDSYDPGKVKELTEQVAQKRADLFRLQTEVESQFRQILTPDQFFVFRDLVREIVMPGRRPLVNPAARQQRMQNQQNQQNPQNKTNPQSKPDGN
jgi:Spy/CpxP family protein refolding chaperone